jgi:type I restriction enzyme M protein
VFKAHQPHWRTITEPVLDDKGKPVLDENGKRVLKSVEIPRQATWFGYWRDDGFMMKKNSRVERSPGLWEQTKNKWLSDYWGCLEKQGYSCNRAVTHEDEWVAEAYLETDYSQLAESDFEKEVKKFLLYKLMVDIHSGEEEEEVEGK